MFSVLWFSVVICTCICQATPANQGRLNQENTFNVHQLIMNYIFGDADEKKVLIGGTVEQRGSLSVSKENDHQNKLANRVLEQVNVNGNRTARAVETLAKEMKSLSTHQQAILEAIHDLADQESGVVTEAAFNETMRRVQSDLEHLIASVRNISMGRPQEDFPTDCNEVFERGYTRTGVFYIKPNGASRQSRVRCEMDGTPWTVLMRRFNGSVDFGRIWNEYKNGFGKPESEYWVGNDFIHYLTVQRSYRARFDMKVWSTGATSYSEFTLFSIGDESSDYQLSVSGESGTAKRGGMAYHNGMKFSTKDRDNDEYGGQCAVEYLGGWWFKQCYYVHLTGRYDTNCDSRCSRWHGGTALKEMSIRVTRI